MSVALPIEENPRFRRYTASQAQKVFAIPFPFQQEEDISVQLYLDGRYSVIDRSLFSIVGAMDPQGGSVTFHVGRSANEVIVIIGEAILERLSSIVRDGRFASKLTDDEFDRNRIIQQEQQRDINRALKAPYGSDVGVLDASSPSTLLHINGDGNIVASETPINEKTLREAGDKAVASLIGQAGFIEVPLYDSRYAASLASIKPTIQSLVIAGNSAVGDAPLSVFKQGDATSAGGFTSDNGVEFKLASRVSPNIVNNGNLTQAFKDAMTTADMTVDLPKGDYPIDKMEFFEKALVGDGVVYQGGEPYRLNRAGQSARDYLHQSMGFAGDVSSLVGAIGRGTVRVAFWGDSIAQGLSQIDYDDSWAGLLEQHLRTNFPSVNWVFGNFSIGGTSVGNANSATYVGAANSGSVTSSSFWRPDGVDQVPPSLALFPGGTIQGKTWKAHVKDFNPDLLFIAFGMNSGPTSDTTTTNNTNPLRSLVEYEVNSWSSKPSVALVTTIVPTRKAGSGFVWQDRQLVADAFRAVATEFNLSLVDANALQRSYMDGIDVTKSRRRVLRNFGGAAAWEIVSGSPSITDASVVFSGASTIDRRIVSPDGDWSYEAVIADGASISFTYRMRQADRALGYVLNLARSGANINWSWIYNGASVASGSIPNTTTNKIKISVNGCIHDIWINGTAILSASQRFHYGNPRSGINSFNAIGSVTLTRFYSRLGYPAVIGHQMFSEADLMGVNTYNEAADWTTNDWSLGGYLNHPSILGHRVVYFEALRPLLAVIERSVNTRRYGFGVTWSVNPSNGNPYESLNSGSITRIGANNGFLELIEGSARNGLEVATGFFKVPRSGLWLLTVRFKGTADTNPTTLTLYKNTTPTEQKAIATTGAGNGGAFTFLVEAKRGESLSLYVTDGPCQVGIEQQYNFFGGYLVT